MILSCLPVDNVFTVAIVDACKNLLHQHCGLTFIESTSSKELVDQFTALEKSIQNWLIHWYWDYSLHNNVVAFFVFEGLVHLYYVRVVLNVSNESNHFRILFR